MGSATILVVDDTSTNLLLLEGVLTSYGYDVRTAISGEGALRAVKAEFPDLILLDIMMPGIDGYETCRRLKSQESTASIPVIFLSAKSDTASIIEGFNAGGVDYVGKPFNEAELISRVNTHLQLFQLQQQMVIANRELELSRYDLQKSFEVMNQHIIYAKIDSDGNFLEISDAFCRTYGYARSELIGVNNNILKCKDTSKHTHEALWKSLKSGKIWEGELKNRRKDGTEFWVKGYIEPLYNGDGTFLCYSAIYYDINDKKRIEKLSITDQLTELYNRRYFEETLPVEFKRAARQRSILVFMMLDIDYFKQYNDTYGHQEGDRVLVSVGAALKRVMHRQDDLVYRLGGEEFGVVCSVDNTASARIMAQKVCAAIEEMHIPHSGSQVSKVVTASVGAVCIDFAEYFVKTLKVDEVYKMADDELYRVKAQGRNSASVINYGDN